MMKSTLKSAILWSLAGLLFAACGEADGDESLPPPLELKPGQLVSSEKCGACHTDIYGVWSTSVHARAASTPVFLEAFDDAVKRSGDNAKRLCLQCHAPASVVSGNLVLSDSLNQEGVNCDFCHSLVGLDLDQEPHPYIVEAGGVKFGPIRDAVSSGHPVAYSEFHAKSEHCAGCHEYRTPSGVELITTYSEWLDYSASPGAKTCQQCHMPLVIASVADPRVSRVGTSFVNLHSMPGGHSLAQLVRSLRMRILEIQREKGAVKIRVSIKNSGAGHSVPTGIPTRKVALEITAETNSGVTARQEYAFQRVVLDASGEQIQEDSLLFFEAAAVRGDTRIAPGEERIIETTLSLPEGENAKIRASLNYVYSPHNRPETETRFEFYSEQKDLVQSWTR